MTCYSVDCVSLKCNKNILRIWLKTRDEECDSFSKGFVLSAYRFYRNTWTLLRKKKLNRTFYNKIEEREVNSKFTEAEKYYVLIKGFLRRRSRLAYSCKC